jgi:hypothetical protein
MILCMNPLWRRKSFKTCNQGQALGLRLLSFAIACLPHCDWLSTRLELLRALKKKRVTYGVALQFQTRLALAGLERQRTQHQLADAPAPVAAGSEFTPLPTASSKLYRPPATRSAHLDRARK